jgi:hypothetical protein
VSRSRRLILALGLCAAQLTLLSLLWDVGEARADAVPVPILEEGVDDELLAEPPLEPATPVAPATAQESSAPPVVEGEVVPAPAPAPALAPVKKALPVKSMGGY